MFGGIPAFIRKGVYMARMAAGARKRDNGTIEKRITINGKRYSIYGKTTKEVADKEQELRNKVFAGAYVTNQNITFDKYFNEWIERKKSSVKGSTIFTYKNMYKTYIETPLGNKRINKIERREILQLQQETSKTKSAATCNLLKTILNTVLKDAVLDEIISKNPAANIKNVKADKATQATNNIHRALTEEEQKAFMQELRPHYYYEFIALLLSTGMRCGECAALQWADIDYKNNVIHITKTTTTDENGHIKTGDSPKSDAGMRDIPINATIKNILEQQRAKMGNIYGIGQKNVFLSVYGYMVRNAEINKTIIATLEQLAKKGTNIEIFTVHALRDTFATRYIEQGGTPQTLKTILGHSNISITMDLYAHVLPNTKQSEMDKINIVI